MSISHACRSCGYELAFERSRHDPELDARVVTCPRCGRAGVRRRHPLITLGRRTRAATLALVVLTAQIALAIGLGVASRRVILDVTDALVDSDAARLHLALGDLGRSATWLAGRLVIVGFSAGVWLGLGLAHWRWWSAWLAWAGLLAVLAVSPEVAHGVEAAYARLAGEPMPGWVGGESPWFFRLDVAALLSVACAASMPAGRAARVGLGRARRALWRRRLRRRREGAS